MDLPSPRVKSYFLSPITTLLPEGPIQLGSIVEDPSLIQEPISKFPVPPNSLGEKVYVHNAVNSAVSLNGSKGYAVSIFTKFQLLLQGKIGSKVSSAFQETWFFDNLQTKWFTPSDDYVRQSLQQTDVQNFIAQNYSWLKRIKLYMVTGVMVAYGASSIIKAAEQNHLHLSLGIGMPLSQIPNTRPQLDLQGASGLTQSQQISESVIFAFQLRRIKISPAGDIAHAEYNQGALLSNHQDVKLGERSFQIFIDGIDENDVNPAEFGLEGSLLDVNAADGSEHLMKPL
ncbi:hypothetical protein ACHAQJ_006508 [Trichoderma viride]